MSESRGTSVAEGGVVRHVMRSRSWLARPYLVGLAVLVAVPAAGTVVLAFTEFSGLQAPRFVGLDNLVRLAGDEAFWRSLGNSLSYIAISVPLRLAAAIA